MAENTRIIRIKERVHQSQWSYKQLFMIASSLILIFTNFQTDLPKQRDLNPKRAWNKAYKHSNLYTYFSRRM